MECLNESKIVFLKKEWIGRGWFQRKQGGHDQIQDVTRRAVAVIKPHIMKAFKVISLNMVSLDIPVGFTVVTLTLGTILAAIDIAVLFVNVVRLAKQEEHPGAIKIKSTVENLKDERDRLQSFYRALQESVITITTADT